MKSEGRIRAKLWFDSLGWDFASFQLEAIDAVLSGKEGIINAPTGSGKTYSLFIPALIRAIDEKKKSGLQLLWITPLRALAADLKRNMQLAIEGFGLNWEVGVRTGDVSSSLKSAQLKKMPEVLIITPESLHLFFTRKEHERFFDSLRMIVVDEWHELLGTKRGVQTELALAHLKNINPAIQRWGISATIGNLQQAADVLLGSNNKNEVIIRAREKKKVEVVTVLPDRIDKLPWAGYLGVHLLDKVIQLVEQSKTTLLFTNTRSQTEIWYRHIMDRHPELAGLVALHHGSLEREIRTWVEEALHNEKLKLVICTSSLDLGVDFRPVETVIQIGSPKSVSRFLQRAGRSGHQPDAISRIYFVPTNAIEILEAVALKNGVKENKIEPRTPIVNPIDVLTQYAVTIAVGNGFRPAELFNEVKNTHAFKNLTDDEWAWILEYITTGGPILWAYDEFKKVEIEDGLYQVKSRKIAMRHRLNMGTIVSDSSLRIKYLTGKYLGTIEENFISRMNPGDVFSFAGMNLEFIRVREMTVQVRRAGSKNGAIPRWMGGRIPLSGTVSESIRQMLDDIDQLTKTNVELKRMEPLLALQKERSHIPSLNELLIEKIRTREGYHLFFYPFDGRLVHEGMASLIAYRISRLAPVTFSIAMNDYGFELLSDREINIEEVLSKIDLFTTDDLTADIQRSVNSTELAKRKFREIASIAGLIFKGFPGKQVKTKHLQASSSLFFEVLMENEPDNLLINQAYKEVFDNQLEELRLRQTLHRLQQSEIVIRQMEIPSPFAFPILVDRMREQLSSEKLEDRIERMLNQFKKKYGTTVE